MLSQTVVIVAGSESYALDIGRIAAEHADAYVVRYAPLGEFGGSMFELFRASRDRVSKITSLRVPFSARGRVRWVMSRLPLFVINFVVLISLAARASTLSRSVHAKTCGIGIGWGGALTCSVLKYLGRMSRVAYYRVDWFVLDRHDIYSSLAINFFRHLDDFLSSHSDYVWNLTRAIAENPPNVHKTEQGKLVVLPPIITNQASLSQEIEKPVSRQFVHFGEVKPGCGLPLILEAFGILRESGIKSNLAIVGRARAEYLGHLYYKFASLFNEGFCEYLGPVNISNPVDWERLTRAVRSARAGLAITPGGASNTSNFAFQNRIVIYLANLAPTVINKDSAVADWLLQRGLGLAVDPTPEKIAEALRLLLESEEYVKSLKSNIRFFLQRSELSEMMQQAISTLLNGTDPFNRAELEKGFQGPSWQGDNTSPN